MKEAISQIKSLAAGDLVCVELCDASIGKSLSNGLSGIDVPVKSWGVFIGVLGKRREHVILAQNAFRYSDGLFDIDYTAVPLPWATSATVIAKSQPSRHLLHALNELEQLGFDVALMGSAVYNEKKLQQTGTKQVIEILTELSQHDATIRRRITCTKNIYPKHEEFTQKINTFGNAELAEALKKLSFAAQTKTYLFWKKQ